MTDHNEAVVATLDDLNDERPDRSLVEQFVDLARADSRNLVGPGGLLADVTKRVVETG
jgi:hypothetical protein